MPAVLRWLPTPFATGNGTGTDPARLSPDGYEFDIAYMGRPGADGIQLDLILDYRSNVALYPAFLPAGATAFLKHLPEAEAHLI